MRPDTIGPYQVERELGRGGMGEVFLARDTRLDRQVAIKALPAHLAQDADRLTRFQREAKVLASLSHANIGAIYGLEEAEGRQYLVLEFIEGETLAERLVSGAVPVEEALSIARQTAEALEAAHEKGIVHRDVKPGNVMVTPEGIVKVLDFGLARSAEGTPSTTNMPVAPGSPTVHSPTIPGVILGTAGYMSPEQARGKPVDKRSDIFSFGCVVYELLTGTCPFPGETVTDSLGAILHREPDWTLLPAGTPPRVRELLRNCMAKDRRNRLHDIGDARLELERAIGGHEWASAAASTALPKRTRFLGIGAACVMALVAGGGGWLLASRLSHTAPIAPAQSFHVSTTIPGTPPYSGLVGISPDARFVVYTAWPELELESMKPQGVLVVRRLDSDETTVIEGTEGARNAALSPDGRWVVFSCAKDRAGTRFTLKKVALENGRPSGKPQTICDLAQGTWFSLGWASDREIVFSPNLERTVYAVSTSGGEPRVLFREDRAESLEGWQEFRPLIAGQSVLTTHFSLSGGEKVKVNTVVIDLASGKRTVVLPDAGAAQLVTVPKADGKGTERILVAARSDLDGLVAVRFDPTTVRALGDPVTVWSGSQINRFDLSPSGTLAMATQVQATADRRLAWIDEKGQPQPIPGTARAYAGIAISPDGARVAANLDSTSPNEMSTQVWVQDLARNTSSQVQIEGYTENLLWSDDGRRIAYGSFSKNEFSIWERPAVGSGQAVKMFATPISQQLYVMPSAWSPDGKLLAVVQVDIKANKSDVLMLEQGAGGTTWKATPYLNSAADEHALRFSPDGKWVIFCSVESGRHELYAQRFTGAGSGAQDAGGRVQVSTNGHDGAIWWSADGKEVRFIDGDKQVMSVEVQTEPTFSASLPKVLYSIKDLKTRGFSWSPDGRLMVILEAENERPNRIDLVVNFLDELRTKMAVQK